MFGIRFEITSGVWLPDTIPIEELVTVNEFVEMDIPVPLGLVFEFTFTETEVANTWKLPTKGGAANVNVDADTVAENVAAPAVESLAPAWNPYAVAVERFEITNVVFAPATIPIDELETLKFPPVPVEIATVVPFGLVFDPKVMEMEVKNT